MFEIMQDVEMQGGNDGSQIWIWSTGDEEQWD
jgi:hypothetical protein